VQLRSPFAVGWIVTVVITVAWIGGNGRAEQNMNLAERVERKDWRVVRDMTGATEDTLSAIAQLTTSPDREVRILALSCLDEVGGPVARRAFLNALEDREEDVRDRAVQGIEHHATDHDLERIVAQLKTHGDEFVRERLALVIGRIAGRSAVTDLKQVLEAGQPKEVSEAIRLAMARLGDADSKAVVLAGLESPDIDTRRMAIEHFVYLRDPASAPRLLPLLDDRRDALKAGPTPSKHYLRICDLAMDALGEVLGSAAFPFATGQNRRYSEEELATAKRRLAVG
jgi:HEAT repeat protein